VDISQNEKTGWCMILGSKGSFVQLSNRGFVETGNCDSTTRVELKSMANCDRQFIRFLKVEARNSIDSVDVAVSIKEDTLSLHYLTHPHIIFSVEGVASSLSNKDFSIFA
ncbi:hypothetical protein PFISCL1PPCAC_26769, partial [Pristionchus fissidentatus]